MTKPAPGGDRRCAGCGTILAADNTARLCGRCHREQNDALLAPPVLKNEFFDTDEFRTAFQEQDIGKVFKAYRTHPRHLQIYGKPLNQELLARWLRTTQANVSRMENGAPDLSFKTLQRYAEILHLPRRRLWFALPGEILSRQPQVQTTEVDLLEQIDQSRRAMDSALAQSSITPAQIDNLDEMVGLHARDCVTASPVQMLHRLTLDFRDLQALISRPQSPIILGQLYSHVARIGALVADELMVLGDTHRAWTWHRSAVVAADDVGLSELQLQVRSLGILIPLYYGDSNVALKMAMEAFELGESLKKPSSASHSLAATLKALLLAQVGLKDEARVALNDSGELFSRLAHNDKADSVFGFSERRWRFYRARTLAELGDFEAAWEAQEQVLGLYPADIVGDPAIVQLDRALCLVRKSEIDAGCELAAETILKLPTEHRAKIFLRYGNRVLTAVPEKYSTTQAVAHCREVMAESDKSPIARIDQSSAR